MRPTTEGRFCGKCQHAVVDFSGWDRSAVVAYKREHPEACGLYRAEHLEPHLVPLADLLKPKRGILAASLAIGATTLSAQAVEPAPSDYTRPAVPVNAPRAGQVVAEPTTPAEADKNEALFGTCARPAELAPVRAKPHRFRKVYVSKRFPFIHFRRPRVMGRFASHMDGTTVRFIGTPSF